MTDSPHYWTGALAMTIALAVREPDPKWVKRELKRTLDEFKRSSVATPELRAMLERVR